MAKAEAARNATARHLCIALATAFSAMATAPAWAQSQQFQIIAKGAVPTVCTNTVQTVFAKADFGATGSAPGSAKVNCNGPFAVRATSANGAVVNGKTAPQGFSNKLVYNLTVTVPLDSGASVSAMCGSASLTAGKSDCTLSPAHSVGLSSNGETATEKTATLSLAWTTPTTPRLLAGSYADVLTVTVSPQQ
jgi:hypothetical protein